MFTKDDKRKENGINWISMNAASKIMISHNEPKFDSRAIWLERIKPQNKGSQYNFIELGEDFYILSGGDGFEYLLPGKKIEVIISDRYYSEKIMICSITVFHNYYKNPALIPDKEYYVYER